jgi:DNA sulfur modification protein DndE
MEGGVEISWRVFAGEMSDIFAAIVYQRTQIDGCGGSSDGPAVCLRAHVHRGLGYLASEKDVKGISGFLTRWLHNRRPEQEKRT